MRLISLLAVGWLLALPVKAQENALSQLHFDADNVSTMGRVNVQAESIEFGWPGVTLSSQFEGSAIGVRLNVPQTTFFNVYINEKWQLLRATTTQTDYVLADNLPDTSHTVQLMVRGETHLSSIEFKGWLSTQGQTFKLSSRVPNNKPIIQYFTDSFGVGYGNESQSRTCSAEQVAKLTNHQKAWPALTAEALGANYHSQSYSGLGVVRNWGGLKNQKNFRYFRDLVQPGNENLVWQYNTDQADMLVVQLGNNDFNTALHSHNPEEPWRNSEELKADFKSALNKMLDELQIQYGKSVPIVLMAASGPNNPLVGLTEGLVEARQQQGQWVSFIDFTPALTELSGCHWHPNASEHQHIAKLLISNAMALPNTPFNTHSQSIGQ